MIFGNSKSSKRVPKLCYSLFVVKSVCFGSGWALSDRGYFLEIDHEGFEEPEKRSTLRHNFFTILCDFILSVGLFIA